MTVTYRAATLADAPVIEQLFHQSFTDTFGHLYAREDLAAFLSKMSGDAWTEEIKDHRFAFRLAEGSQGTLGYAKIGPVSVPVETAVPALELRQLYLLPRQKGQGIGPTLLDWALAEMRERGAEEAYLSVYVDNHRARRLYERYGFEEVGSYHFMVGNHADDDRIMRLRL